MREMKDSGIEWIDEIPLDWTVKPLKWMVKFGKGLPITKENLIEQGVPVVSYGQIHSKTNNGTHLQDDLIRFVSETYLESNPLSLGKKGDIFFADTSEDYAGIGNAVLVDINTPVFAGYHIVIVRPDDQAYSRYLAYLFLTDAWRSQLCSMASGIKVFSITQGLLKKTTVILPPAEKAVAMTDYLDRKCSQIDAIIVRQQEVIEKLKAYKLSVITEAVTKGLNPDVPMKGSGLEWIGEIPQFATVTCARHLYEIILGKMLSPTPKGEEDTLESYFCAANVHFSDIDYDNLKTMWFSQEERKNYLVNLGDLLIVEGGAGAGGAHIVEKSVGNCYIQNSIMIARSKSNVSNKWLYYTLYSLVKREYIDFVCNKATIPHFTKDNLGNTPVVLFPREIEETIVAFLDKKCSNIDNLIFQKERVIQKLTDYKKSLIYEVVTGKKEV